jgi:hypothetical protein
VLVDGGNGEGEVVEEVKFVVVLVMGGVGVVVLVMGGVGVVVLVMGGVGVVVLVMGGVGVVAFRGRLVRGNGEGEVVEEVKFRGAELLKDLL